MGSVSFSRRMIRERAIFAHVRFSQPPDFWAVENHEHLDLTGARFGFRGRGISNWTTDTKVADNLRRLRGIAKKIHATDAERDLFILERMAERGVLWKSWWDRRTSEPFGWWRPLAATVLMFFYWALSNCGRSVALPVLWFIAANTGAYYVYSRIADTPVDEALRNLTFANMLPFGTLAKPLSEHAAAELFYGGVLPPAVGLAAIGQGVVNALLVFLLALALRNHFKVK
ncbi:MAG: hypothetical protein EXR02_01990 [Rhodospirillales bacterium]|nr:hypothetical protein [Rhodospirillales bacterium]